MTAGCLPDVTGGWIPVTYLLKFTQGCTAVMYLLQFTGGCVALSLGVYGRPAVFA